MKEEKQLIRQGWIRALLFAIILLLLTILSNSAADWLIGNPPPGNADTGKFLLIRISISFIISVLSVYLFRTFLDKQTLASLGLQLKNNLSHGAAGFFLGIFLLGTGTFFLIINDNLQWIDIHFDITQLFIGFGLMVLIAFAEEMVFRGYLLNNLMQSMNKWLALVISALLFALFHRNNPGITPVSLINIFLAGMVLGINYIYTKNLWFGILFHFGWNFYQGSVLGYKVSGVNLQSVLEQELSGNPLLTGVPFGFEGSVIAGVLSLVSIGLLAWVYEKRYGV